MRDAHANVVQVREFVRSGDPVFKVGRTGDVGARLKQYPKGSHLVVFRRCAVGDAELVEAERALLGELRSNVQLRQCVEYGREYFEGDTGVLVGAVMGHLNDKGVQMSGAAPGKAPGSAAGDPPASSADVQGPVDVRVLDGEAAVAEFVRARQDELVSTRVLSRDIYASFQEFMRSERIGGRVEHAKFTRCICSLTGARSTTCRTGLLVDRYIEFPSTAKSLEELVSEFVAAECTLNPGALLLTEEFSKAFVKWAAAKCDAILHMSMSHNALIKAMRELGFSKKKTMYPGLSTAANCFVGLALQLQPSAQLAEDGPTVDGFIRGRLDFTDETKDHVNLKELYADYTKFCNMGRVTPERKSSFKKALVAAIGAMVAASNGECNFWKGWRLRQPSLCVQPPLAAAAERALPLSP